MKDDDLAVSDVVGTIMMVGITLVMFTGLGALIAGFDGPQDELHVDLSVQLRPGAGGWATGDEFIYIEHHGGETIRGADIRLLIRLPDGTPMTILGKDAGFANNQLAIGGTWIFDNAPTGLTLAIGDEVAVDVVVRSGSTGHIAATGIIAAGQTLGSSSVSGTPTGGGGGSGGWVESILC